MSGTQKTEITDDFNGGLMMDIRELYKRYGSGHVACIDDTVVAHDKTFKKVFETVKENGLLESKRLVFRFIPPEESVCVYQFYI